MTHTSLELGNSNFSNDMNHGSTLSLLPLAGVLAALAGCGAPEAGAAVQPDGDAKGAPATEVAMAAPPAPPPAAAPDTIDLRRIGYDRGAADAPVVVIEFSDFGCPFCATFATTTYPALHREFVATGKVRWKYVPFVMGMFPNGAEAARAAECAGEQGKFWAMHDRLFQHQGEWKRSRTPAAAFAGFAAAAGVDRARFGTCYRADGGAARTRTNNRAADAVGIRATPSFLINGRLVEGALPLETFRQVLNAAGGAR